MRSFLVAVAIAILLSSQGIRHANAAPEAQGACLFFTETAGGQGGFSVCDDGAARFRSTFDQLGLQRVGYPISQRYTRDGFVTQAFQKAILQWRPESQSVAMVNIFDDLSQAGYDKSLLDFRQTPVALPAGWDGETISFDQVTQRRQALLDARPALRATYFSSSNPLLFFGLPTSEVADMGNHYAVRLQRSVLQEWKEDVPWARAGEVTIANGGDIAKELGGLPPEALAPAAAPPAPTLPTDLDSLLTFAALDIDQFWQRVFTDQGIGYNPVTIIQSYTEVIDTACGSLYPGNAAYCGLNGGIYYDLGLLEFFYNDYGAFAVLNVFAHEWGHHVTREMGLFARYTIQNELLADCLAGAYSRDADARGLTKQGDMEGAMALFYDLGDTEGVPWFDRGAHGTPDQRQQAFGQGFQQGVEICFGPG